MRREEAIEVYSLWERFIETCILNNDSLLTSDKDVFTQEAIDEVYHNFVANPILGKSSFDEKIVTQFKDVSENCKLVMAHGIWLWCMAPDDFKSDSRKKLSIFILANQENINDEVFTTIGFGSAGPYLKRNKPYEIAFCISVFRMLKIKATNKGIHDISSAKEWIEKYCLKAKFNEDHPEYFFEEEVLKHMPESSLAMFNILLHITKPEKYERIASDNHKNNIYFAFQKLLDDADEDSKNSNREEKIWQIRNKIAKATGIPEFDFYDEDFRHIWDYNLGESDYNEFQALLYKKAVVLYGPPGTSKTHSAKQLAQTLILQYYFASPDNVKDYILHNIDITTERIHRLQLHPNYSYEDFIAGIQILGNETKPVKGDFLKLIEKVREDDFPHVLILDEINRVDISRLFGELFSALENREEEIQLSVGGFTISVPSNLYIIGTMNEIDFSLERLDFALRRRFVWFFYGYHENGLRSIIYDKMRKMGVGISEEDIEKFVQNVNTLNQRISENEELGDSYQIGHTFFSEIVDIYKSFKDIKGRTNRFNLFLKEGPVNVLWDISIGPILSAFLGNTDTQTRNETINDLKQTYLGNG